MEFFIIWREVVRPQYMHFGKISYRFERVPEQLKAARRALGEQTIAAEKTLSSIDRGA